MSAPSEPRRAGWGGRVGSVRPAAVPLGAAALLCAAGAATAAFTVATVYRLHVPLPYWDEWYNVIAFRHLADGTYGLGELASQHNEHRILFPRLFFIADERLFGLSGVLDITVTLLLQAANAALLIGWMARIVRPASQRALLGGFVVLTLFTLRQEQNFTNGFQLQFVGVYTAAALAGSAYVAALRRSRSGSRRAGAAFFALAAVCCAVATYTMANGVLAGGVLAVVALLRRAPWRFVIATLALAAALAALFFHGYRPGGDSLPLSQAVLDPLPYLAYVTALLGSPLGTAVQLDQGFGVAGLALAAAAAWRVWRGHVRDDAALKLFTVAVFALTSAAATAYGRIALGADQAVESRYATPAALFWCALVLFWFPVALPHTAARRRVRIAGLGAVMAALAAAALLAEATAWPALAERSTALRRVSDSLASGLYDVATAEVYENATPDEVALFAPFLREHRLAAFADPVVDALDRQLAVLGAVSPPDRCGGSVAARADAALGTGGVRLEGWAWDAAARRAPRRVVVTDAAGRVVGFGSAALPSEPHRSWFGYARAGAGASLQAYALLADGDPCRLGAATVD